METSAAPSTATQRTLTSKQIMSILGLVPLGVYVIAHLWTNMYSLGGAEVFDARMRDTRSSPSFIFLEVFGLGLPILAHAWIGIQIIRNTRANNVRYPKLRNLKYLLQRASGIGLLLFIAAHVFKARYQPSNTPAGMETWQGMHEAFTDPTEGWLTLSVYALGMLGIAYHLANGVWGSALTLGLTVTPRAQRRMEMISAGFFVVILGMALLAIYGFKPFSA